MNATQADEDQRRALKEPLPYRAEQARQGVIILDRPWRRVVFFGGLILAVVLAILVTLVMSGS